MISLLFNRKIAIHTLGCKVNACESDAMQQMLVAAGCVCVPFEEKADIYIINTCTVTNIADRKSRQMLHRARALAPDALIVATGCYVQERHSEHMEDGQIDVMIGNRRKGEIAVILGEVLSRRAAGEQGPFVYVDPDRDLTDYEDLTEAHSRERCRVFLKIQDGCNQFCSYCIIPYARGRISSRNEQSILREIEALAADGVREVVLNGIHLSSYGLERFSVAEQAALCPREGDLPLLTLLEKIGSVVGPMRIRLGSLEPRAMTEEVIARMAKLPYLCPQFHLSLQSGCDRTLKAMNRKYTADDFREVVRLLRKYFDDPAITTDIIAGFPGETEEDHAVSAAFAREIAFSKVHVFPYSRRKGTVADRMDGQLTEAVKKQRASELIRLSDEMSRDYHEKRLNRESRVLFEEKTTIDGTTYFIGYSREYVPYAIPSDEDLTNREITVVGERLLTDGTILARKA